MCFSRLCKIIFEKRLKIFFFLKNTITFAATFEKEVKIFLVKNTNSNSVNTLSFKTVSAKKETVVRKWYIVDADGETVGRISSRIASVLRGKHKPDFTPHVDTGDNIIVINANKVKFTGNKMADKIYISHSLYPGGQKKITAADMMEKKPLKVLEKAIKGMLPKTKLGDAMIKKLFLYEGGEHPHAAQKPEPFKF